MPNGYLTTEHLLDAVVQLSGASSDTGPALVADGLQVDQDVYLQRGFAATGGGDGVAVDLTSARLGGSWYSIQCPGWNTRLIPGPG